MCARVLATLAATLCAWLVPARAQAWQEAHQAGEDTNVRIEPDGTAVVQQSIRWRAVHGPLRFIDVANVDPAATVDPTVVISSDDGRTVAGHWVRRDGADSGTLRVTLDDPRAATRGTFTFDLRWRIDLVATGALKRDGSTWRLALSQPPAAEGFDGSKTVIDVPSAPDPPAPIVAETGLVDDGALSTLKRSIDRDVLELVRPHVARGEAVAWTVRVDGRALSRRALLPAFRGGASAPGGRDRVREVAIAPLLAAVGLSFGLLLRRKARTIVARYPALETRPRSLVPMPLALRAIAGGWALAAGVGCEWADRSAAAGVLVAGAVLLAAWRAPPLRPTARGPGRWLVVRPIDAFARASRPSDWFDVGTGRGRVAAVGAAGAMGLLAVALHRVSPEAPWFVAMDGAPLLPLFITGWAWPTRAGDPAVVAPWLSRAFRRLSRCASLRVAPWARIAQDGSIDELRLLIQPRAAIPGVVGIELGMASSRAPNGPVSVPQILVRVLESSAACAKLTARMAAARIVTGRRPDERVLLLTPETPTCKASATLVEEVVGVLRDKRIAGAHAAWSRAERRAVQRPQPAAGTSSAAGSGLC